MTPGARQTWRAVAATLGACLLVTLVSWAALIGPSPVLTGPGPMADSANTTTTEPPIDEVETRAEDLSEGPERGNLGSLVITVIGGLIVVFAAAMLVLSAYLPGRRARTARRFRRTVDPPADVDFETLAAGDPQRVRRVMASDADEQLRLLLEGHPRNAIVACWHRFELQAVEAGLARHPRETSSEFALRLLDRADVDPRAVSRLLELYREARFSEHDLDEDDRDAAAAALRQIRAHVVRR
ncbi:DUF4129 domain-containing protein [Nocardioides sp. B-3]|uniref:DUF4129 domain-containing protein n=1 Tax=Nocardioides sp. B-3 TaxID=2895565 RepID=UPI0021525D20|nr:DUF4129 domain-containing protein [Nocardioides sp. B-3]UUZ58173.1 DUF4129 domain-containing protein [Nocardioides sp. B-3]